MGNIRYQRTAHRITSAVNCRPLKPSPRSICPAAPYPTGVHIPGIPPPAKFATEPTVIHITPSFVKIADIYLIWADGPDPIEGPLNVANISEPFEQRQFRGDRAARLARLR